MAEKARKKLHFLSFKSRPKDLPETSTPKTPETESKILPPPVQRARNGSIVAKSKRLSTGSITELVQCPLCLERLHNPKMLACQHTFCLACLSVYIADLNVIECPMCYMKIQVTGADFMKRLPSNVYIDSLLRLMGTNVNPEEITKTPTPPQTPVTTISDLFPAGLRCSQCQSLGDMVDTFCCNHCKQHFCRLCWTQHLEDLQTQIGAILKQLDSAANRLDHKIENYRDRCERLTEQITETADEKIAAIITTKDQLLKEAASLQKTGEMSALALKSSLDEAQSVAQRSVGDKALKTDNEKITKFMNLHNTTIQLFNEVAKWGIDKIIFDKQNFCIELDAGTPVEAESDDPLPVGGRENDPLENEDSLVLHYRSRNFVPHYVWRKTPRPGGVASSPWNNHLYICGMDTHNILVVERTHAKIVSRISCDEMLCPTHIAFMRSLGEIYVTDKWKHCVHVFSKEGQFLRSIGQKGSRPGMFRSPEGIATDNAQNHIYVVDTGNDRVQILQPDGKYVEQIGVITKPQPVMNSKNSWQNAEIICTELNAPTSVAVTNDRVVVLDSGNKRVKIYNKSDRGKIFEFGALGQRKGQFRQPEVLTVDPLGFIIVGDSGNSRVQIFKPSGQLVRVFGGLGQEPGKFGWISGIHVTKQLDIIVSDTKNHCVNFI